MCLHQLDFQPFFAIIPPGCRCCPFHIDDEERRLCVLNNMQTFRSLLVNKLTMQELVRKIEIMPPSRYSFELSSMSNTYYITLTGISKGNFEDLHFFISTDIQNTQNQGSGLSLWIFHLKLRFIVNMIIFSISLLLLKLFCHKCGCVCVCDWRSCMSELKL